MKTHLHCSNTRGWSPRLILWTIVLGIPALMGVAREATPPLSWKQNVQPLTTVQQLVLPPTDVSAQLAKTANTLPLEFAVPHKVAITPATHGTWEQLPEGRLWRVRVVSASATDMNVGFSSFWLPKGATLHVSSESEDYFQGPYTAQDNKPHGQLWSPVVPGETVVVELFVPTEATESPQLVLGQVGAGFRDFFQKKPELNVPKAGACNVDVICPQGDPWRSEIRSVGVYTVGGVWTCTGTLVGNTANDFRNFFLTANHCGLSSGNAATMVVYWNFESPVCGQLSGGSLGQNQSGAIFRAARGDVDFALVELEDIPDPSFNVHYAGWDRSGTAPGGIAAIHHPSTDEKCISFSTTPLTTVNSCIGSGGVNSHWWVQWSLGVTEPGSSGSGIWDSATHRYVGFLSGGPSACGAAELADCYGKFSVAWSGASSANRLSDWLDPIGTGAANIPGLDPFPKPLIIAAGSALVSEGCTPANGVLDPGEEVTINLSLRNVGTLGTTNLVATLEPGNGVSSPSGPKSYGALAAGGAAVAQQFTFTATGICGTSVIATLQLQDGDTNLGTVAFSLPLGTPVITSFFSQNFDGVTAPALPAQWVSSPAGLWTTVTTQRDTLPNAAFTANPATVSDRRLETPAITINSEAARLTFRHRFITEEDFDGGALEISTGGGAWADIVSAGGLFVTGGYNGTLSTSYQNPLGGRAVWTGTSSTFMTTTVDLPVGAPGRSVRLRWRYGTDSSLSATGWHVDTVSLQTVTYNCCSSLVPPQIVNPRLVPSGQFAFSYDAILGRTYVVEGRTNLVSGIWYPLQTNLGDGTLKSYTNSGSGGQHYFRLRAQ